ncbi:MAG: YraN family protein [Tannerellaceae bacterium]|jgi:putative endonuclease|nr:YraN family protein [Tannerellaceae bacterium]
MMEQNLTGKEGEEEARKYLQDRGYDIFHVNWRWKHYELDIVAAQEDELVVVEVKTRSEDFLLSPEESVDRDKIRRLIAAADVYVRYFGRNMPVRFDIITLIKSESGYEIEHIEDAFHPTLKRRR